MSNVVFPLMSLMEMGPPPIQKKNLRISGLVSRGFQVPSDTSDLVGITSTDIYGLLGFTLFF